VKTIHLPLLPSDAKLAVALQAMRWLQKSAVVSEKDDDLSLVSAGKVVYGLAHQKTDLSEVKSNARVLRITRRDALQWNLDLGDPYRTERQYEQYLDQYNAGYGVVETVPGLALVVTRRESLADEMDGPPGACYCLGDCEHKHDSPPAYNGQTCFCGEEISCVPAVP
jgi:hypothetical protein